MADEERSRLRQADGGRQPWRRWGPYLSERAWGTVREDYSADGEAWGSFPFDHAHARTFRWSEDGLAGMCDVDQLLCLSLALWNGRDPILKERAFGLSGNEGNHGEDAKDHWWYLDATPTASWLRWRYHYPQAAFPYDLLRTENRRRSRLDPEFELVDTGVFAEDRFWIVSVEWAKASPEDLLWRIEVRNAGPDTATIDVLPTAWFRNLWSWGVDEQVPSISVAPTGLVVDHHALGRRHLVCRGSEALVCDNESNTAALWASPDSPPFPKDGIGSHVIAGTPTVNPAGTGTKAALRHHLTVAPRGVAEIRLRFSADADADLDAGFASVMADRLAEADGFYRGLTPDGASTEEARVLRQAFSGMIWSKQFYHYDVERWLDGDPGQPPPPPERHAGRNSGWRHLNNHDVISMPDPWEYPWYASWDLAFHCVALAHLDPTFAKDQLLLLAREWYMHPNGQLPAYEWNFSDVNPPVQAWAALRVLEIDAQRRDAEGDSRGPDLAFLERMFHKLLLNFTWWVNRKDAEGLNIFEGGFLGLDNIGMFDRSKPLPVAGHLEQSDGTAWMAMYCLNMLEIALVLAESDPVYEDTATKFFEHFTYIAAAMQTQGLWDDDDGYFYDVIHRIDGERVPIRVRSMVGVVALFAVTVLDPARLRATPEFRDRMDWFLTHKADHAAHVADCTDAGRRLLAVVDPVRLERILTRVLDESELLSPHGLRSLSRAHGEHPVSLDLGGTVATIDYEPAESTSFLFGGNSNWRGPVWFPLNYLFIESLGRFHRALGDGFTVEHPTGSGVRHTLAEVADDIARRLCTLFLPDDAGHRPVLGDNPVFDGPEWHDQVPFHEYFHGETGAGLGASHQTGWTGLVADLIADRRSGRRR